MARYKDYSYDQTKLIPIAFHRQVLPGSFEYTLNYLIDHEVDLSVFEWRYRNDETGAPAYDPAILLKVILYAYSRGVVSSREMARLCRENVVMMALSADSAPHFTTIAEFISSMSEEVTVLFRDVLLYCDELGLIGKDLFAIDGCKLSSNAAREWSGTKADLKKKQTKMERAVRYLLKRHRELDGSEADDPVMERERQQLKTLREKVKKLKRWLSENEDKPGKTGKPRKSNLTDNESAKIKGAHGIIQGYDGVATVDAKHQVIIHAEAFGEAQEHDLLMPMVEGTRENFQAIGKDPDVFTTTKLTADAGFHTERNMQGLFEACIDGYVADNLFRKRDPRFAEAPRHKEREREGREKARRRGGAVFINRDFHYEPEQKLCICPAGRKLYRNGGNVIINGYQAVKFRAPKSACRPCGLRAQCLRHPDRTEVRQVHFFSGETPNRPETLFTQKMKCKIDSALGRFIYGQRLATVEPVFANMTCAKGLNRFTLRSKPKVDIQWKLYCVVHNIGKVHRYAAGFG